MDTAAVLGLVAVLGFPLAAAASASRPPPPSPAGLPPAPHDPGGAVGDVPAFVPSAGLTAAGLDSPRLLEDPTAFTAALTSLAVAALGPVDAGRLLALPPGLGSAAVPQGFVPDDPGADAVLSAAFGTRPPDARQVAALTDLGALLQLGEADGETPAASGGGTRLSLPPDLEGITVGVLGRAAASGSCPARLDDLLELLSDRNVSSGTSEAQLLAAERSCPRDPTPLWLAGEAELFGQDALATFHQLERSFPGSPGGWSGEADVVLLRAHDDSEALEPFTADEAYRRAALLLDRARSLLDAPDPGLASAEAQAWTESGRPDRAVPLDAAALTERRDQQIGLQFADDLERTHRFGRAAGVLGHLPAPSGGGPRTSLFPAPVPKGTGPSLGAGTRAGLTVQSTAVVSPADEVSADVLLPPFRTDLDPFTGHLLSDPADATDVGPARARDLLLSGDPEPAARSDSPLLAAMGRLAAGRAAASVRGLSAACAADAAPASSAGTWCDGVSRQDDAVGVDLQVPDLWYEGGGTPPTPSQLDDRVAFDLENLWRWAGNDARAAAVTAAWERRSPRSFLAADQAGEVAYLRGQDSAAERSFARAVALAPSPAAAEAEQLKRAEAEAAAGEDAAASERFAAVARTAATAPSASANLRYLADFERAGLQLRLHDIAAAVRGYETARSVAGAGPDATLPVEVPTALETDQGLAEVQAGRPRAGLAPLRAALGTDPGNPVFLQNVAYAERRLGETARAVADYRSALAADPTNYPAANDLGVLLADQGRLAAAAGVLQGAVGAGPQYALARFNLGVVLARQGPAHVLEADGDRGAAVRMDPSLADAAPVPRFDDGTVLTTLDLSRPPPPGWHFAEVERVSPGAAASLGLLVLLVALGRELARDKAAEKAEEQLLDRAEAPDRRRWWSRWRPHPLVATAATVAVLTWPLASSQGATWTGDAVLALAVVLLVAAYVRVHLILGRSATSPLRHHTWVPPLGVAAGAALAHLAFAPVPVAEPREEHHRRRRWMAPFVIGATGVVLLVIGRLTGVPSARAFGSAALVITSSALLPVEPSDGAYLGGRLPALVASVTLLTLSILLFLGIL